MTGIIVAVKPVSNGVAASRVRIRIPLPARIAPLPVLHHPINSNTKEQRVGEDADNPEGAHRFPFRCLSGQPGDVTVLAGVRRVILTPAIAGNEPMPGNVLLLNA